MMSGALVSMVLPLLIGLLLLVYPARHAALVVILSSLISLLAAAHAMLAAAEPGTTVLALGGWEAPLAIRFRVSTLTGSLLAFTALVHLLVALYAGRVQSRSVSRAPPPARTQARAQAQERAQRDYWPLSCFLHAALAALWMSADLFNIYVTLELVSLAAVALVVLAGAKGWRPALHYLLLSLAGSLFYLLGVALLYGRYGVLDIPLLAMVTESDRLTRMALVTMTLGLMLKGALWPLHLWLPSAHASAPTPVSALLSGVVVKGPLFVLWTLWVELAPADLYAGAGLSLAGAGVLALLCGGWQSLRAPQLKVVVAYSTVAQLGYATLALGLLLAWELPRLHLALWLFVLAHGLAKVSMFLAAGEMQETLRSRRVSALRGATQTMPVAMFAFAVAGGSLIGLPPSGGFLAKWELLLSVVQQPERWPWLVVILLATLLSAAYVFRVTVIAFGSVAGDSPPAQVDRPAQWLALLPALLVWGMALVSTPLIFWLTQEAGT